ncbi:MAG: serine hydroxymethyltransferase [Candidatus Pacebacteria bacterium]|nr:serine hydroxymethyltransferase [Candidatus Paceibacterota bacterium]
MKDLMVKKILTKESERQKKTINLIASENYVSQDVKEALASDLGNKYAEGYPGARYYRGNIFIDELENLAITRAGDLFNLNLKKWGVNVQALSGSPANLAVYHALVPLGGKIMGMKLSHGGHLTHGHAVSVTGKLWKQVSYELDPKTERLDYEKIKEIATKERPDILVVGYSAYSRKINFKKMREAADAGGSILMVDISHIAGLVATGLHPSPFVYADVVTTTTHKTLRGPRGALIFSKKDTGFFEKIQKAVFPGLQGGPHMNQIAGIAVALKEAKSTSFKTYIQKVINNTKTLSSELQKKGWRIVSGGTDNHLFLLDVWNKGKGLGGKEASEFLEKEGIIVNMNTIPFDTRSPQDPSGIRLGMAFETTKGIKEKEIKVLAGRIDTILRQHASYVSGK